MKTIIERLELLPEPIRSRALKNYMPNDDVVDLDDGSMEDAINYAFHWMCTEEGDQYWRSIYQLYVKLSKL